MTTDAAVDVAVYKRFHKLVGVLMLLRMGVVARLYTLHHIGHLTTFTMYKQIVSQFYAIPVLVAIHCVVTANDRGDSSYPDHIHVLLQVGDETLARPRIGVTTVHKAMNIAVFNIICFGDVDELQQMGE